MGVPAFFRWLTRKYPSVIIECVEQKTIDDEGNVHYEDMNNPNPNRVEFDNLYLDMNGIIHPCTHPEDKPAPKDEDEMMLAIFECIDRLMNIVRPRKVLYMAIDGVAPRAKMNQQRSRRFRASKETAEKVAEVARIREELQAKGAILPPEKEKGTHFDSNCITPGTPFMDRLSKCLQYYVHERLNNNPSWKNLKVILSDANVPGEGEHKIMDYIRKQRVQPDYDPNTHHVLCGADADLIMLGLATHETHFTIIREEFLPNKERPCDICQLLGHEMKDCVGLLKAEGAAGDRAPAAPGKETQFIFVRLNVLKEYLQKELDMPNLPFPYDFERVLDDWVFMCFFVGNDFLPHLPSLEIRENAIDRLVTLYKKCVYKTRGYLTDSGSVLLERVEMIMTDLGYAEDEIFRQRKTSEDRFKERNKRMRAQQQRQQRPNFEQINRSQFAPTPLGRGVQPQAIVNPRQEAAHFRMLGNSTGDGNNQSNNSEQGGQQRGIKRKAEESLAVTLANEEEQETPDEVRLWEDGFKDRYYESKFDVSPQNVSFRQTVAWEYVRGLCWVLKYYYQGCASWEWYFPYHYAPFASDFKLLTNVNTHFDKGTPFKPLQQLMGVFPAASRSHVPPPFAELMDDPKSPIIDFYPIDFHIDLNGKKFAWQGVALLPFVDEKRLFKATDPRVGQLTDEERRRNENGNAKMFILPGTAGYRMLAGLYEGEVDYEREVACTVDFVVGLVVPTKECVPREGLLSSPIPGQVTVSDNRVLTVDFIDPKFADDYVFPARKLENAKDQPKVLSAKDGPVIGFGQRGDRAHLDASGHRMVNNRLGLGYGGRGGGGSRGGYGNGDNGGGRGGYGNNDGWRRNDYQGRGGQGGYDSNNRQNDRGGYQNTFSSYNSSDGGSTYRSSNSYSSNNNAGNAAEANNGNAAGGGGAGRSVFEQLSSQIQQYQQQMMSEISRNSQPAGSTVLPNPFATQSRNNYDSEQRGNNSNWMNNNGGRPYNRDGGQFGRGGGGGRGGQRFNNNNNNGRFGQNNYGSSGGGGYNRYNNNQRN
ncbi:5'-3' exoribonuclease 2 homolog [Anopheles ziemanni]|uniref:5'-3' exoribonuclease 2 homolog n=1 Tax=Anopheles coustani TaxID=139045 RepID=UPI002658B555|nr:5'-3' exoribonuclease 2 homolog [Anopheles coustani]XP_058175413.1 5'-3' exoribonuclease 2 homolog [Anopheles ziemanni]